MKTLQALGLTAKFITYNNFAVVLISLVSAFILIGQLLQNSRENAPAFIEQFSKSVANELIGGYHNQLTIIKLLAQIQERYDNFPRKLRREIYNSMISFALDTNPMFVGMSACWKPNAIDGLDDQYKNQPGTDATGRFIPYCFRTGNQIQNEPLVDYQTPGAGDCYLAPLRSGQDPLSEHYFYPIAGKDVYTVTISIPIKKGAQSIGVATENLPVEKI